MALSAHNGSLDWLQDVAFTWAFMSLLLLGSLVAVLPLLIYEWIHDLQAEYPDE